MPKQKQPKMKVTFSFAAPEAKSVLLAGDFYRMAGSPIKFKER